MFKDFKFSRKIENTLMLFFTFIFLGYISMSPDMNLESIKGVLIIGITVGIIYGLVAVGIPDEGKGSKIILSIVPLESEKNLNENLFIDLIIKDLGKSFKPDKVIFVKDLPKTRNMKIMRRVIKSCLTNKDPGDVSTLLNPESVEEIKQYAF